MYKEPNKSTVASHNEDQQENSPNQSLLAPHPNMEEHLSFHSQMPTSINNAPSAFEQASSDTDIEMPHADVLLVTVTKIETQAVLDVFREKCGQESNFHFSDTKTYYELGVLNGAQVFLMQCEMGVSGPGSSLLTVYKAIQVLGPSSIIMTGIACGVNRTKQRIGDILVSRQLYAYEIQRISTTDDGKLAITPRGDRVTASVKLLDRFMAGSMNWMKRPVHFGPILSGEKLIDNIDFLNQLLALEPEAIGGEMEGVGLYSAATQDKKVDWILAKAICDWADGNKSGEKTVVSGNGTSRKISTKNRDQKKAARNVAEYVFHVLSTAKFT